MADRSPRAVQDYRDFGIDPELVAAPALPDEDEPLRLDSLTCVPAYLGHPRGAEADAGAAAGEAGAADAGGRAADAEAEATGVASDASVADATGASDAHADGADRADATGASGADDSDGALAGAASAGAVAAGALAVRDDADEHGDIDPDDVDADLADANADMTGDDTDADDDAADVDAADDGTNDEPVEVLIDEDAPSATASAANASEAAVSGERTPGFTRRGRRKQKASRRKRGTARSRAQERRRRGVASTAARTGGTVAAVAIVAASVWALGWMPLPQFQAEAESVSVTPQPGDQLRVCPGPLQQLGVSSDASEITSVGSPVVASASQGADPDTTELGGAGEGSGPSVLSVPGTADGKVTQLTAAQTLIASGGSASGFSATACMQPSSSQWLLSGDTTVGHTLVLDVVNPGNVDARVNFSVFDANGPVSPSIPETVIAPGERQEISLAGIAPDAESLAIQVTSTGAEVASYLHETVTSTLDNAGSDIVGPSALPSTEQALPGVYVYEHPHEDDTSPTDQGTAVRIANPNEEAASATLQFYSDAGEQVASVDFDLQPNTVIDYPVTSLASGTYSIRAEANQPIAISGRVAPMQPDEFGWQPSSPALSDEVMVAIPSGPSPQLSLSNFSDETRTVTIAGDEVTLAPYATERIDASGEVEILGAAGMYAAVSYAEGGRIASFPVQPGNADAEPILVTR